MMKAASADSGGRRPALGLVLCVVVLVTGLVSARAAAVTIQETTIALEPGEVRTVCTNVLGSSVPRRVELDDRPDLVGHAGRPR